MFQTRSNSAGPSSGWTSRIFVLYVLFTTAFLGWVSFLITIKAKSFNPQCDFDTSIDWFWDTPESFDEACVRFDVTRYSLAITAAVVAFIQSCVQCYFLRRQKVNPVEMVVAHTIIMIFAGVTLALRHFGAVLTLRGEEVRGREYSVALGAGLAANLFFSFMTIVWSVIIWTKRNYYGGSPFNTSAIQPPQSQHWPTSNTNQHW